MSSPGFSFERAFDKRDGTHERIETNSFGDRLKKYQTQNGNYYSSVQFNGQSRQEYLQSLNQDTMEGFRSLL